METSADQGAGDVARRGPGFRTVQLATEDGDRGYEAELRGEIEVSEGKVTRFDMVCLGEFWGDGPFTKGAPKGKFPLAVSFTLAEAAMSPMRFPHRRPRLDRRLLANALSFSPSVFENAGRDTSPVSRPLAGETGYFLVSVVMYSTMLIRPCWSNEW